MSARNIVNGQMTMPEVKTFSRTYIIPEELHNTGVRCVLCGNDGDQRCSRCGLASYCTRDCQRLHWRTVHRVECVPADGSSEWTTAQRIRTILTKSDDIQMLRVLESLEGVSRTIVYPIVFEGEADTEGELTQMLIQTIHATQTTSCSSTVGQRPHKMTIRVGPFMVYHTFTFTDQLKIDLNEFCRLNALDSHPFASDEAKEGDPFLNTMGQLADMSQLFDMPTDYSVMLIITRFAMRLALGAAGNDLDQVLLIKMRALADAYYSSRAHSGQQCPLLRVVLALGKKLCARSENVGVQPKKLVMSILDIVNLADIGPLDGYEMLFMMYLYDMIPSPVSGLDEHA